VETPSLSVRHSSIGDGTVNVKAKRHMAIQYMHKINVKNFFHLNHGFLQAEHSVREICMHACTHVQIYTHMHTRTHTHAHARTYAHTTTHTHMHTTYTDSHISWMLQ